MSPSAMATARASSRNIPATVMATVAITSSAAKPIHAAAAAVSAPCRDHHRQRQRRDHADRAALFFGGPAIDAIGKDRSEQRILHRQETEVERERKREPPDRLGVGQPYQQQADEHRLGAEHSLVEHRQSDRAFQVLLPVPRDGHPPSTSAEGIADAAARAWTGRERPPACRGRYCGRRTCDSHTQARPSIRPSTTDPASSSGTGG